MILLKPSLSDFNTVRCRASRSGKHIQHRYCSSSLRIFAPVSALIAVIRATAIIAAFDGSSTHLSVKHLVDWPRKDAGDNEERLTADIGKSHGAVPRNCGTMYLAGPMSIRLLQTIFTKLL